MRFTAAGNPRVLATMLSLAVIAVGCGSANQATEPDNATETSVETSSTIPEKLASADETELTQEDETSCLIGEWLLADAELSAFYQAASEAAALDFPEIDFAIEVSGMAEMDFTTEGTFEYRPDLLLVFSGGPEFSGEGLASGALTGTYGLEEDVVATTITNDQLDVVFTVGGTVLDTADAGLDLESIMPISNTPVDCSGPNPVLILETSTVTGDVFPLELQPR